MRDEYPTHNLNFDEAGKRTWGEGQEVRKAVWKGNASRQGKLIANGDPMQWMFGGEVTCSALWEHRASA